MKQVSAKTFAELWMEWEDNPTAHHEWRLHEEQPLLVGVAADVARATETDRDTFIGMVSFMYELIRREQEKDDDLQAWEREFLQ